MSEYNLVINWA